MGGIVSPTPTLKQRLPRVQSPTTPYCLHSNDDNLERAQARAARAAASRRKSLAANPRCAPPSSDTGLEKQQIIDLFNNCIKLASENKINQKNTWELNLIDHLGEIIKTEEDKDAETNFQKASCTLEAGVKIYSLRVDSVHSEAYKVLGGITRGGLDSETDNSVEHTSVEGEKESQVEKKENEKKISTQSTLETSFSALNVKKFDVAFAVDPLYHKTSAQFDEGGAKGLLLNNLGVYGGCRVFFDSQEIPGKTAPSETSTQGNETIDVSFLKDTIKAMIHSARINDEISPTLSTIISHFNEDNRRQSISPIKQQDPIEEFDENTHQESLAEPNTIEFDANDAHSEIEEEEHESGTFATSQEMYEASNTRNGDDDDEQSNEVDSYILVNLGITSKQNSWAGPDHWKFRKTKASDDRSPTRPKRKQTNPEINFLTSLNDDSPDIFCPPRNNKTVVLPTNKPVSSTKLPEDCHYQPENLVRLFLLPNITCAGKRRQKAPHKYQECDFDGGNEWDDESVVNDGMDKDCHVDDETDGLISKPRQVRRIEVEYDTTSKQVDVQSLKETLWQQLQEEEAASFKEVLAKFPEECSGARSVKDVSPHLCFICLLHLANEHGLSIVGSSTLDDLTVHFPPP